MVHRASAWQRWLATLSWMFVFVACGDDGGSADNGSVDVGIDLALDSGDTAVGDAAEDLGADAPDLGGDSGEDVSVDDRPELMRCEGSIWQPPDPIGFEHGTSEAVAALGADHHSMQDVIVRSDSDVVEFHGKFNYGLVLKDLEDEQVQVHLDTCDGYSIIAEETTDSDGRIAAVSQTPPPGIYAVRLVVLGDATFTVGRLFVLPPDTSFVVFDIDGTLTTSDGELFTDIILEFFEPILAQDYIPEAWPGGQRLTNAHVARNAILLYLTGRPYWLTQTSREWLDDRFFPIGALHTTDSNADVVPTNGQVGEFKKSFLLDLLAMGFDIDAAYGNATTDIYAYLEAGIPAEEVYIIGAHGGEEGTQAVSDSWEPHAVDVEGWAPLTQPFR